MQSPRIEIYPQRRAKVGRKLWNWRMIGANGSDKLAGSNQGYANQGTLLTILEEVVGGQYNDTYGEENAIGTYKRRAPFDDLPVYVV